MLLHSTFFPVAVATTALLLAPLARAGSKAHNEACSPGEARLQVGTYQFYSDCNTYTFCNSSSICDLKRCRRDEYPFGYPQGYDHLPPRCERGQFCPDEGSECQNLLAVGSPCQFNRDDQCAPPDDWRNLRDLSGVGLNVNGSLCLNNVCTWANVSVGETCITQNTGYVAYGPDGEFIDIVSRGNCKVGLYCDSQQRKCIQAKKKGESCDADKECASYNCGSDGKCDKPADAANKVAVWVYVIVALCIIGGMAGTLVALYFVHRRERDAEREKRIQYWREQQAFRQNIAQMRSTAANSILSLNQSTRSTMYSREGLQSEDSQLPMLQGGHGKGVSGLRHATAYSDDGNYSDEGITMEPAQHHSNRF